MNELCDVLVIIFHMTINFLIRNIELFILHELYYNRFVTCRVLIKVLEQYEKTYDQQLIEERKNIQRCFPDGKFLI